ncbi:MAG: hypothetical protein KAS97_13375, partial [Candidatus Aminicenantes bacterium]|nr:hypothetical protein [Candidatus Aminicenantes bacterium]
SRSFYNKKNNKAYFGVNYPGQIAHITSLDLNTGKLKKICNIKGPDLFFVTSLAYDPSSDSLFFTTDNNYWRDIKKVDIKSGKTSMLMKDARIGDLAFNRSDRSLWGVRHYLGISTLVNIPYPYNKWNQVFSWDFGNDIYDIDISPNGKTLIGAVTDAGGKQFLVKMEIENLLSGDFSYDILYDFGKFSPANFVFSDDGKFLFGSSYYSGVSNIYRYDLEKKDISIISNCKTGYFRPTPVSADSVLTFRYTSTGFIPAIIPDRTLEKVKAVKFLGNLIAENHPQVKEWSAPPPSSVDIDKFVISKGKYNKFRDIKLKSIYPVIEGYKDTRAYGFRLDLSDSIPLNSFNFTLSYSPDSSLSDKEKIHFNMNMSLSNWSFSASHNKADFYDLFGPTKTSRKGNSLELQYKKSLIFDDPKNMDIGIKLAAYYGLEKMPEFQNVDTTFDEFYSFSINLNYKNLRASLGAVDYEKGLKWGTFLTGFYVNKDIFPRIHTNLDLGIPLPVNHSAIWIRSSLGYAWGERDEPFANFYFGGFGNNWVDHRDFSQYRQHYSFPGIELNGIGGRNFGKAMIEWTLPPLLFKRLGIPSFYANWAGLSVFASGLATNFDNSEYSQLYTNIGAQLDIRFILLSNHQITLSLGYAKAFTENSFTSDEWMISVKLL